MTIEDHIIQLVEILDKSQWDHQIADKYYKPYPVITRSDLRKIPMEKGHFTCRTSGSTGEPVTIQKTFFDYIWYIAAHIRELKWRNWDVTKNLAIIRPDFQGKSDEDSWRLPRKLFPVQGSVFCYHYDAIPKIQAWLEAKNPHYIHTYPSILRQLDLTRIPNLLDTKSTGEQGGTCYSSEECGTIALQCPDDPSNWHVMENQIVEADSDNNLIITTITNKYIKRYKHGDVVVLGSCTCGRKLQTLTEIRGRVRNMFVMPDGSKKWPLVGSRTFYEKFGIEQFKVIQKSLMEVELQIKAPVVSDEGALIKEVQDALGVDVSIAVVYVDSFSNYKHEEFISLCS
jgi:phenylacetate-CoA ligase